MLTGDFLTTTGTNIESDRRLFEKLGFEIKGKRGKAMNGVFVVGTDTDVGKTFASVLLIQALMSGV